MKKNTSKLKLNKTSIVLIAIANLLLPAITSGQMVLDLGGKNQTAETVNITLTNLDTASPVDTVAGSPGNWDDATLVVSGPLGAGESTMSFTVSAFDFGSYANPLPVGANFDTNSATKTNITKNDTGWGAPNGLYANTGLNFECLHFTFNLSSFSQDTIFKLTGLSVTKSNGGNHVAGIAVNGVIVNAAATTGTSGSVSDLDIVIKHGDTLDIFNNNPIVVDNNAFKVDTITFVATGGGSGDPDYGPFNKYLDTYIDGYVDTGDWLAWVYLDFYPYVYIVDLNSYIYNASGNWFYIPD